MDIKDVSMEIPMKCRNSGDCSDCDLESSCSFVSDCVKQLAAEIQRLRDEKKINPGVWDQAPDNAPVAQVDYLTDTSPYKRCLKSYMYVRKLPKTFKEKIAEELCMKHGYASNDEVYSTILEAFDELEKQVKLLNGK